MVHGPKATENISKCKSNIIVCEWKQFQYFIVVPFLLFSQGDELKKSNEVVTEIQTVLEKLSETEEDLKNQVFYVFLWIIFKCKLSWIWYYIFLIWLFYHFILLFLLTKPNQPCCILFFFQKKLQEEEVKKNAELNSRLTELEQYNKDLKKEMLDTKQSLDSITQEMEQRKKDHADQMEHLQEELSRWERQSIMQAGKLAVI